MVPDVMLAAFMCSLAPSEYRERHSLSALSILFIYACVYNKDRRGEEDGSFNLSDARINKIQMRRVRDFATKKGFAGGDI
jgi:hypothetical protein